jgi:hypothetical protein
MSFLLKELRKYNVGTTIAFQTFSDLRDTSDVSDVNQSAALQTGNLVVFNVIPSDARELAPAFNVKPQPQWEEEVEEIEGTEPILSITQTPVEHLLRSGHRSAVVRQASAYLLQPLKRAAEEAARTGFWRRPNEARQIPGILQTVSSVELQRGLASLDRVLVDLMEQRLRLDDPSDANRLLARFATLIAELRCYFRLGPSTTSVSSNEQQIVRELSALLVDFCHISLSHWAAVSHGNSEDAERLDHLFERRFLKYKDTPLPAYCLAKYRQAYETFSHTEPRRFAHPSLDPEYPRIELLRQNNPDQLYQIEYQGAAEKRLHEALKALRNAVIYLFHLCEGLHDDPILVDSGQQRPRIRKRYIVHPEEPQQNVWNKLARQIANLPRFNAYYKVQGSSAGSNEAQVATILPDRSTPNAQVEADIKEKSATVFGRRWEEVGEEIDERQEACYKPPEPARGTLPRRPPR